MAKQGGKKNPEDKARRKLKQTELKLRVAEDRHAQARARGKQEVEQARLRAAKWMTKAAEEVERRREQVARAEARLFTLLNEPRPQELDDTGERVDTDIEAVSERLVLETADGWDAVDVELLRNGSALDTDEEPDLFESAAMDGAPEDSSGFIELRDRELRALQVLHEQFAENGATVGEWRAAAAMPETTFARARRALIDHGLIEQYGDGGRTTRYMLTNLGHSLASIE